MIEIEDAAMGEAYQDADMVQGDDESWYHDEVVEHEMEDTEHPPLLEIEMDTTTTDLIEYEMDDGLLASNVVEHTEPNPDLAMLSDPPSSPARPSPEPRESSRAFFMSKEEPLADKQQPPLGSQLDHRPSEISIIHSGEVVISPPVPPSETRDTPDSSQVETFEAPTIETSLVEQPRLSREPTPANLDNPGTEPQENSEHLPSPEPEVAETSLPVASSDGQKASDPVQPQVLQPDTLNEAKEATATNSVTEQIETTLPPPIFVLNPSSDSVPSFYLFSSPSEDSDVASHAAVLFEDQPHLFQQPLQALFSALRDIGESLGLLSHTELSITSEVLDLTLTEDNIHAREICLSDLNDLHVGCEIEGDFTLRVNQLSPRFITRYNAIVAEIEKVVSQSEENDDYQYADAPAPEAPSRQDLQSDLENNAVPDSLSRRLSHHSHSEVQPSATAEGNEDPVTHDGSDEEYNESPSIAQRSDQQTENDSVETRVKSLDDNIEAAIENKRQASQQERRSPTPPFIEVRQHSIQPEADQTNHKSTEGPDPDEQHLTHFTEHLPEEHDGDVMHQVNEKNADIIIAAAVAVDHVAEDFAEYAEDTEINDDAHERDAAKASEAAEVASSHTVTSSRHNSVDPHDDETPGAGPSNPTPSASALEAEDQYEEENDEEKLLENVEPTEDALNTENEDLLVPFEDEDAANYDAAASSADEQSAVLYQDYEEDEHGAELDMLDNDEEADADYAEYGPAETDDTPPTPPAEPNPGSDTAGFPRHASLASSKRSFADWAEAEGVEAEKDLSRGEPKRVKVE